jgi:hypothetical protein
MEDGKIIVSDIRNYWAIHGEANNSQCAVDFGTTYSGVAYAYFEKGQDVRSQPGRS